jgi:hypothetical protein
MLMTGSGPDRRRAGLHPGGALAPARGARAPAAARARSTRPASRLRRAGAAAPGRGIRGVPVEAISGTLEPSRARLFDHCFRPAGDARRRGQRLWLAEHRGAVLPPISVVAVGDAYAVRDGHHRVSVARARRALTIDATVECGSAGLGSA